VKGEGSPAVFLDRDGTLVDNLGFLGDPERVRLLPGVPEALDRLARAGFLLVVVTNQSAVARGLFTCADVEAVNRKVNRETGDRIDRFYYCPHHPEIGRPPWRRVCPCRKPAPGMIEQAIADLAIDPAASFCVGDQARDLECCRALPVATILVLTGRGKEQRTGLAGEPDRVCADLAAATDWILGGGSRRPAPQGR